MKEDHDVIIIGAGITGLVAARHLSSNGMDCLLIEAAENCGGRIRTITGEGFETPAEAGAEFIHGKLKNSFALIREAGLETRPVEGEFLGVRKGRWSEKYEHDPHWEEMMKALKKLDEDMTISRFLNTKFPGPEYANLREAARRFAEGFDLADINEASILAVRSEWQEIDDTQYRLVGGYGGMIEWLELECRKNKVTILRGEPVRRVVQVDKHVKVETHKGKSFTASRAVITASVGALRAGDLEIDPLPSSHAEAIRQTGFGAVIKILIQFRKPFWTLKSKEIGFLLTDEEIPTWWTQHPEKNALLTGWLGGPSAEMIANLSDDKILSIAIGSLERIFDKPGALAQEISRARVFNWVNEPFIRGGYNYKTLYTEVASNVLADPINDAIYFAGEACSGSDYIGTVEAALESGMAVAEKINRSGATNRF